MLFRRKKTMGERNGSFWEMKNIRFLIMNNLKSFEWTWKNFFFYWINDFTEKMIFLTKYFIKRSLSKTTKEIDGKWTIFLRTNKIKFFNDKPTNWKSGTCPSLIRVHYIRRLTYTLSATLTVNKLNLGLFYPRAPKMFQIVYKRSWFSNIIISVGASELAAHSPDRGLLLNLVKFFKFYKTRWSPLLLVLLLPWR